METPEDSVLTALKKRRLELKDEIARCCERPKPDPGSEDHHPMSEETQGTV